ncbi:inactive hydroxysteroid dehydrogenase-like protein 1 [Centruroides vittatus]|uniref:inactive hydroxysteroid dehydrogenase-like protein 1 n=1 Tax=Centruroides vittatus TaxID=120091 RepID=UPI00350F64AE
MTEKEQLRCEWRHHLAAYEYLLVNIGILTTLYVTYVFCKLIFLHFLPRSVPSFRRKYGEWALITGGNSGIGRSYAFLLAEKGTDVIITGRDEESLRKTAEEIEGKYGVRCRYVSANFTEEGEFRKVALELKDKDVGILVHNAGTLGNLPRLFLEETEENVLTMINIYLTMAVRVTYLVLPSMMSKRKGAIIFLTSFSSLVPTPGMNTYSACKGFWDHLARSISVEYSSPGLHIQSLSPFYVKSVSKSIRVGNIDGVILTADDFARKAITTLGLSDYTSGYFLHDIFKCVLLLCGDSVWKWFMLNQVTKKRKRDLRN